MNRNTLIMIIGIAISLSSCNSKSSKINEFLDNYESTIENFESMADDKTLSIEDISKINHENLELLESAKRLKEETEWSISETQRYLELTRRFSEAMMKMSRSMQNKNQSSHLLPKLQDFSQKMNDFENEFKKPKNSSSGPVNLVVKKMSLGMTADEAIKQCNHMVVNTEFHELTIFQKTEKGFVMISPLSDIEKVLSSSITDAKFRARARFEVDSHGKITTIELSDPLVDVLFNTKDLDAEEFVEMFTQAYNIPYMKTFVTNSSLFGESTSWEFTSPHGWQIVIESSKTIKLIKKIKASERKFD